MKPRPVLSVAIAVLLLSNGALTARESPPSPRLLGSAFYDAGSPSIALRSPLEQIWSVFGLPTDELGGDDAKILRYPGLELMLERPTGSLDFTISRIEVTGANRWTTPGLAVGMAKSDVKTLLGKPDIIGRDWATGNMNWHYLFDSGQSALAVTFVKGLVGRIELHTREVTGDAG